MAMAMGMGMGMDRKKMPRRLNRLAVLRAIPALGIIGLLAWSSAQQAIGSVYRASNAELALRFTKNEPVALAKQSSRLSSIRTNGKGSLEPVILAQRSLRFQALNPSGLVALGIALSTQGRSDQLNEVSTLISRHNEGGLLENIKRAAQKNDAKSVLKNIDILLTISNKYNDTLFPILNQALSDGQSQLIFAGYIIKQPAWLGPFLSFSISSNSDARILFKTILTTGNLQSLDTLKDINNRLLSKLAEQGAYGEMWQYFIRAHPKYGYLATTIDLSASNIDPQFDPVSWNSENSIGIETIFEANKKSGSNVVNIRTETGQHGIALRKLLNLSPGSYSFQNDARVVQGSGDAQAVWNLECLSEATKISIWKFNLLGKQANNQTQSFIIPQFCSTQSLSLFVAGGSNQLGQTMTLGALTLKRLKMN
jgi:hypothetical protein